MTDGALAGAVTVSDSPIAFAEVNGTMPVMSIDFEREIADLKRRMETLEAKVQPTPSQRWRAVVSSIEPNDLTREAARLGAEWRAEENQRR